MTLHHYTKAELMHHEFLSFARLKGKLDPCSQPHLWALLTSYSPNLKGSLEYLVNEYGQPTIFDDAFVATAEKTAHALMHTVFGGGSLDRRRLEVVGDCFGISSDKAEAKRTGRQHRRGWELGTYRKTKEKQLALPFLVYLAKRGPRHMPEPDNDLVA